MDSDDKKITQLPLVTSLSDSDLFAVVVNLGTAPQTKAITKANAFANVGGGGFNQGFMTNGKISVTVASNNITVALKTLTGTDPTPTDKVQIRIGDVVRDITSALSVTKNAGTNWFNSGGAELATKEVDYFVYIGYNATDGITIGFARIPYACVYSDFHTTTTNQAYCAISTIANAAAGDNYVNIGRFAATLSATPSFNWSVPAFTGANLIQRPVYESRLLTSTCAVTAQTGTPTTTVVNASTYQWQGRRLRLLVDVTITNKGTASNSIIMTTSWTATGIGYGSETALTGNVLSCAYGVLGGNAISMRKYDSTTAWVDNWRVVGIVDLIN